MKRAIIFLTAMLLCVSAFSQTTGKKANQLAEGVYPNDNDIMMIADPTTGVLKRINYGAINAIKQSLHGLNDVANLPMKKAGMTITLDSGYLKGDWIVVDTAGLTPDGGIIVGIPGITSFYLKRQYEGGIVKSDWFGKKTGDDITSFLRLIDGKYNNVLINTGAYTIDSVKLIYKIRLIADVGAVIKLATPSVTNSPALTIAGDSSYVNLTIDGNSTSRTALNIEGNYCSGDMVISNVTAGVGSLTNVSGIFIKGHHFFGSIRATNFRNTGQPNGSVPRLITLANGSYKAHLTSVVGDSIQGAVVVASDSTNVIDVIDVKNANDNGVYHLSGKLAVGTLNYEGLDEAYVYEGKYAKIGNINILGRTIAALGIENGGDIDIDNITFIGDPSIRSGTILRARPLNDSSGDIRIGRISGKAKLNYLVGLNNGITNSLSVNDFDFNYLHDTTSYSGSLSSWANISKTHRVTINNFCIKITDCNNSLNSGNNFYLTLPDSSVLKEKSYVNNVFVTLVNNDGTQSPAGWRGMNFAQKNVWVSNAIWNNSSNPYVVNVGVYNGGLFNSTNVIPTSGWWKKNEELVINNTYPFYKIRNIDSSVYGGRWVKMSEGVRFNRNIFSDYTLTDMDDIITALPNSGSIIVTLPDPAEMYYNGITKEFTIKNIATYSQTNTVTATPVSGKIMIDGGRNYNSFTIGNGNVIKMHTNGTNWVVDNFMSDSSYWKRTGTTVTTKTTTNNVTIGGKLKVGVTTAGAPQIDSIVVRSSDSSIKVIAPLPTLASGHYTATLTNTANITSSSFNKATYQRIGDVISVTISGTITPTAAATLTRITFTLPVNPGGVTQYRAGTIMFSDNAGDAYYGGHANVSATSGEAYFISGPTNTSGNFVIQIQYENI